MDPLSHIAFAWCLNTVPSSGARRAQSRPRGRALAITLGALAPDIDAALMPTGWDRYLVAHEAGTHSLIGAVGCGLAAAGLVAWLRREPRVGGLAAPAVIASTSHVAADLLAGAAIRVWWPLWSQRVENLGVVAMGDPWFVLAACAGGLAMIARPRQRRRIAIVLLGAFAALTVTKTILRERAERAYQLHAADAAAHYLVEPTASSLSRWRVFDRTADVARAWSATSHGDARVVAQVPLTRGPAHLVQVSAAWQTVKNFRRAHDFAFAVADHERVLWSDLRYCDANAEPDSVDCGVWAGGEFSTAPALEHLLVRVGDLVQTR